MYVSNRIASLMLVGLFSLNAVLAIAQEEKVASDHKEFKITTSLSIGLNGPSYKTQFQLVDELGLEYDVMSLVEDEEVRQSLNLSETQFGQMQTMQHALTQELQNQLASALTSDAVKQEIESRFKEVEAEIRSILDPVQSVQLEQVKIQQGIKRFGLPEYLSTSAMRKEFGFTNPELESLEQMQLASKSNYERRVKTLSRQANEALINELSAQHRKEFESLLTEAGQQEFLDSELFIARKTLRHQKLDHTRILLRQLRLKRVQADLKLKDEQFDAIEQLVKETQEWSAEDLKHEVEQILTPDQIKRLNQYGVKMETTRYGAANELCYGLLGKLLGLSADDSERIFAAGQQIFKELDEDRKQAKIDSLRESLGSIAGEKRDRIIELICDSTLLDAENPNRKTR
jgi:hypothetical protein